MVLVSILWVPLPHHLWWLTFPLQAMLQCLVRVPISASYIDRMRPPMGHTRATEGARLAIGADVFGLDDGFPAKPKGMHWRTYRRLEPGLKWVDTAVAAAQVQQRVRDAKTSISLGFAGEGCDAGALFNADLVDGRRTYWLDHAGRAAGRRTAALSDEG